MRARRVVAQVTFACLVALATGRAAWAQEATAPPAAVPLVSPAPAPRECLASLSATQAGVNQYAVIVGVVHPLDEVDIRLDDRQGHWIFRVTQRKVVLLAPVRSPEVAFTISAVRLRDGTTVTCIPHVVVPTWGPRGVTIATTVGDVTPLAPIASFDDPPATCEVPFAAAATLKAFPPIRPRGDARGIVQVAISLAPDSSLVNASIYASPDVRLNGAALQSARASRFRTATFRCQGLAARYLFSVEFS